MLLALKAFTSVWMLHCFSVIALEDGEKFAREMLSKPTSEKEVCLPSVGKNTENERVAKKILSKTLSLEDMEKDIEFVKGKLPSTGKGCKHCKERVQNIHQPDIQNGILVFVSFSMPKISLVEFNALAEKHEAMLVIRGIFRDSFTATKDKILEINKDGLRLNIAPQLFKQYKIKRVPTFVRIEKGQEIARLTGNVSLEFAAQKLQEVAP